MARCWRPSETETDKRSKEKGDRHVQDDYLGNRRIRSRRARPFNGPRVDGRSQRETPCGACERAPRRSRRGAPVFADEEDLQREFVAKVDDLVQSGVKASFHVVSGLNTEPADLIADVAKEADADLIVVGTRGHGRVAGMLLGSVTQRLLHVAPCPVLAVPAKVATKAVVGTS